VAKFENGSNSLICLRQFQWGGREFNGGRMRLTVILVLLSALTLSAAQDNKFVDLPSFPAPGFNQRASEGIYDILINVDGEAFLYVKDRNLKYLWLSGGPIVDKGTNYTQGVPRAVFTAFSATKKAGGGDVVLWEQPNEKNDYTAVIRVTDKKPGADFYHIQLNWSWNPANPMNTPPPVSRGGGRGDGRGNDPIDYRRGGGREGALQVRGTVEDVTVLRIAGDRLRAEDLAGRTLRGEQSTFSQAMPYERLRSIQLADVQGRADIELVEKPWEGNKFTAVVLVSDPQRGATSYSFRLVWSR
jgi:hypothetical protein